MAGFGDELKRLVVNLENLALALTSTGPANVAEGIVKDLQDEGPAWTGQFRNGWVIEPGDVTIAASKKNTFEKPPAEANPEARRRIKAPPTSVGGERIINSDKVFFTVGNEMEYRDIALDLVPGRIKGKRATAPQDWFTTYMQAGGLNRRMNVEIDAALKSVKL